MGTAFGKNKACAQWCAAVFGANTPAAGKCTSDAAHGTGLCSSCGTATPPSSVCCTRNSSNNCTSYSGASCCSSSATCLNGSCCGNANACGSTCLAAPCDSSQCLTCDSSTGACVGCTSGETCLNESCCPNDQVCGSTCGCPSGQTCVNGNCCASGQVCGTTCCAACATCQDGTCVSICPAGQDCLSNGTCATRCACGGSANCGGFFPCACWCARGICGHGDFGGNSCSDDMDCPVGDFCNEGVCRTTIVVCGT